MPPSPPCPPCPPAPLPRCPQAPPCRALSYTLLVWFSRHYPTPRKCATQPAPGPARVPGFTNFRPCASARFHLLWAARKLQVSQASPLWALRSAPGFTYLHLFQSARIHQLWAPRKRSLQVSATLGLLESARFHQFQAPASARFHLLCAPRKLQVSPTLGPSQAAGFTSFGPLGSAPGFSYFGPPQECQVSRVRPRHHTPKAVILHLISVAPSPGRDKSQLPPLPAPPPCPPRLGGTLHPGLSCALGRPRSKVRPRHHTPKPLSYTLLVCHSAPLLPPSPLPPCPAALRPLPAVHYPTPY